MSPQRDAVKFDQQEQSMQTSEPITRRRFIRLAGLTSAGLLAACGVPTATPPTPAPAKPAESKPAAAAPAAPAAQPAPAKPTTPPAPPAAQAAPPKTAGTGFKWDRFKGETIRMIWTDSAQTIGGLQPSFPEFEALTGMKLAYEGLGTAQQRQKVVIELVAKEASLDCFGMQVSQEGRQFWESGWINAVDKFFADKELTDPEWNWEDFGAGARTAAQIASDGATPMATIPATAQSQIMFYREDMLKGAGLQPPKTLEQFEAAAKALHKPEAGVSGVILRGGGKWATTQIGTYLYGMGGKWIGDNGKLAVDTPEMAKTLEYYGGLLRKYGPQGVSGMDDRATAAAFGQGQAAMYTDLNYWAVTFNDPAQSPKIAGQVRVDYIPRGTKDGPVPGGHFIMLPVQNVAMSSYSKHKEATWLWLQWLTSKQSFIRRALRGNASPRLSTYQDKQVLELPALKQTPGWGELAQNAMRYGRNWVSPPIIAVDEFRDIMAKAIDSAVMGTPPLDKTLKEVQGQLDALLERTEPKGRKLVDLSTLKV
jgi:multiple sugar transport system substrate-binding protein